MNGDLLPLKPYLDSVERLCRSLSEPKLTGIILGLAKSVPVRERRGFLETIEKLSNDLPLASWDEGIPERIQALKSDIDSRMKSIADGTYYDEQPYGRGEWSDDELPPVLSEEQKDRLEAFFQDAAQLFLGGELRRARTVYRLLFQLLDALNEACEEHAVYVPNFSPDLYLREAKARYCRCVYETTPPAKRVRAMLGALNLQAQLSPSRFDVYDNDHPMLRDVIDSRPAELAQYREFFAAWRDALKKQNSDRADMLHLEALHLLEGLQSVGGRVRAWGGRQPRAWLFLIRLLALEDDWPAAAAAAEQALAVVEHSTFRARIAERLTEAGVKTHRPELVLTGRREAFFSLPGESRLLLLLEEAGRQKQRAEELQKALSFLRSSRPPGGTPLLVKMLLMAGRLREAFETARDEPALGWSYGQSAGGVLFAGIVSFLCLERIETAPTLRRLLWRNVDGDRHEEESGTAAEVSVSGEILEGLQRTTASQEELSQYRAWATSIGRKRIEQIVSNKHRGAYGRAAEVLGSLAELCALAGEAQQGRELIDEYRNRRFNRYAAFRRELDSVIASSATLKRILGAKER